MSEANSCPALLFYPNKTACSRIDDHNYSKLVILNYRYGDRVLESRLCNIFNKRTGSLINLLTLY